ncbi:hypothetical protein HKCCSP123_11480 [Rhodobacterales bacterium HKCCSP123]|nr:hypothetical protein [Rhodobacterales bacterium HKCCSP123]
MTSAQSAAPEADVINVIFSADQGHAPFAAAVIRSVVLSANDDDRLRFFVLTLGLPRRDEERFALLSRALDVPIEVIRAPDDLVAGMPDNALTKVAYLRFFSGILLPEVQIAVYLDTDILVRCSLSEILKNFNSGSYKAIAVRDATSLTGWKGLENEVSKDFDRGNYFNSGVMVLDLNYLRRERAHVILPRIVGDLKKSILLDQSALNVFFRGNVLFLPADYNYILDVYDEIVTRDMVRFSFLLGAFLNPKIVHFANFKKPWQRRFPQRFASSYRQHLKNTPWGKDALPRLTLRNQVGRAVRMPSHCRRMAAYTRIWLVKKWTG